MLRDCRPFTRMASTLEKFARQGREPAEDIEFFGQLQVAAPDYQGQDAFGDQREEQFPGG